MIVLSRAKLTVNRMRVQKPILFPAALLLSAIPSLAQSKYPNLRPSSGYWDRNARQVPVRISHLSPSRKLATVGDTLYLLDTRNRIIWTWSSGGAPLTDLPVIDSKGNIYVIGYDLLWAALDSKTGKEKWRGTANGKALYKQIELYGTDRYLVVTDMEGYRHDLPGETIEDRLTLCSGNAILWDTRVPAGARIRVRGSKVFWVVRRRGHFLEREISIPRHTSKPIGKVSELAEQQ